MLPPLRWEMALAAVPAAAGYATSAICRMPPSDDIPFRPPRWVFAVVWPVLYALLGFAWYRTAVAFGAAGLASASYALTTALLTAWLGVYSCQRRAREAVFVLLASVLAISFSLALSAKAEALMLIPLLVWASFATLMNAWQVGARSQRLVGK